MLPYFVIPRIPINWQKGAEHAREELRRKLPTACSISGTASVPVQCLFRHGSSRWIISSSAVSLASHENSIIPCFLRVNFGKTSTDSTKPARDGHWPAFRFTFDGLAETRVSMRAVIPSPPVSCASRSEEPQVSNAWCRNPATCTVSVPGCIIANQPRRHKLCPCWERTCKVWRRRKKVHGVTGPCWPYVAYARMKMIDRMAVDKMGQVRVSEAVLGGICIVLLTARLLMPGVWGSRLPSNELGEQIRTRGFSHLGMSWGSFSSCNLVRSGAAGRGGFYRATMFRRLSFDV
ncbi:hypothetical protein CCHR01_16859 [Colletotrichum chrysophilum]|uniref:Uncharacterized protein n=1 Tax=Colletotrichum chrysophilum TaxID=1836956 RepID=A0AAD9A3F5_9PEZI|nr:hypothetical protein CCHR01_16859 [Colletotrichum chrysophilum]